LSDDLEQLRVQLNLDVEWQLGITAPKKDPQLHYGGARIVHEGGIGRGLILPLRTREYVTGSQSAEPVFDLPGSLPCFAPQWPAGFAVTFSLRVSPFNVPVRRFFPVAEDPHFARLRHAGTPVPLAIQ
jgi:hypothetical protein